MKALLRSHSVVRKFERWNSTIRRAVSVTGITGVTVRSSDIDRQSDTEVTVELTFNGNLNTDGTLTFTVGPGAIVGYNGPALTAQVAVSASEAPVEIVDPPRDAPQDDTPPPSTDTRTTFEATTPPGYTRVTLTDTGRVWGIPTQYTTDSNVGAVAYMALAKLMGCNFADAEVARRSIVYIKRQSLGQFNSFASETVCGKTSSTWSGAWDAVRITHLRFYDETSLPNVKEAVYNSATGQIEIPGVWQQPPTDTTNTAPVFADGASTRRTIAENTAVGVNIGTAIAATDADNDSLTYTLSGTDAAAFNIVSTTGQLKIKKTLDYETKRTYTVKITVSDGSLTDVITVTINVTDINEEVGEDSDQQPDTPEQPIDTTGTPTLSVSTAAPLTEATLHGGIVTLNLSSGTYESRAFDIRRSLTVSGITGADFETFSVVRVNDTQATVELEFEGNISRNGTLTFNLRSGAIANYDGTALTAQISVPAVTESIAASTAVPLTEATLDESVVTLTLSGRKFEERSSRIRGDVSVSGISGVTARSFDIKRENDTEVTVELTFNGNLNADGTLTFTVGPDAIAGYNGPALTVQVAVSASEVPADTGGQNPDPPETPQQPEDKDTPEQPVVTGGTPTVTASTVSPLTEAALNGSVVTLTLSGGTYQSSWAIADAVSVSGINGVTFDDFFGITRVSDTKVTIELEYAGNIDTNGTLTFTVGAAAIVDYNGPALTARIAVSANTESVTASAASPLTEATLDESVVKLTLSGAKYSSSIFDIRDAVSVSGINDVTKPWNQPERKSDTELTVELEFDGTDFDSTSTLTFTVKADAIAGYNGPALTTQISVTAVTESVVASTPAPLKEATLDGSVVTLTLSGAKYAGSIWDIRDGVTVSGIYRRNNAMEPTRSKERHTNHC